MASPSSRHIHLSPPAKKFVASLDKQRKLDFQAALVCIGTSTDDGLGVPLRFFPAQPHARCLPFCDFWIVYRVMPDGSIHIGTAENVDSSLSLDS